MIKTSRQALAVHLGMDVQELKDYDYHRGHFNPPVFAFDDAYLCAIKGKKFPFSNNYQSDDTMFNWVKVETLEGWDIYESKVVREQGTMYY